MVSVSLSHRSGSLELGKRNVCGCIVQVQNGSNIRIDQVWPKPSLANSVWALRLLDGLFDRTEAVDSRGGDIERLSRRGDHVKSRSTPGVGKRPGKATRHEALEGVASGDATYVSNIYNYQLPKLRGLSDSLTFACARPCRPSRPQRRVVHNLLHYLAFAVQRASQRGWLRFASRPHTALRLPLNASRFIQTRRTWTHGCCTHVDAYSDHHAASADRRRLDFVAYEATPLGEALCCDVTWEQCRREGEGNIGERTLASGASRAGIARFLLAGPQGREQLDKTIDVADELGHLVPTMQDAPVLARTCAGHPCVCSRGTARGWHAKLQCEHHWPGFLPARAAHVVDTDGDNKDRRVRRTVGPGVSFPTRRVDPTDPSCAAFGLPDVRLSANRRLTKPPAQTRPGCFGKCCNGGFKTEAPEAFLADSPDTGVIVEQVLKIASAQLLLSTVQVFRHIFPLPLLNVPAQLKGHGAGATAPAPRATASVASLSNKSDNKSSTGSTTRETVRKPSKAEVKDARPRPAKWYVKCSGRLVENTAFISLTTILTIYALTGDDLRVLLTEKPADNYFNGMVLACLAIFTFEIFISVLGKADYWLGFFFILDVVSTATLVLDLTWVNEAAFGGTTNTDTSEEGDTLRSGRTARVGAKAARMIRVLRL
ncbi:unnamed protein product, partial [Symbiodinium microadriaticum]